MSGTVAGNLALKSAYCLHADMLTDFISYDGTSHMTSPGSIVSIRWSLVMVACETPNLAATTSSK